MKRRAETGVQAGKRLVENDEGGIVEEGGGDEDALLHTLRVVGKRGVLGGLKREKLEEGAGLMLEQPLRQAAETAYELEVFEAGEMGVNVGFLRHVAEAGTVGGEVGVNVAAFEEGPLPCVGWIIPMTILTVVDLPEPLGPR